MTDQPASPPPKKAPRAASDLPSRLAVAEAIQQTHNSRLDKAERAIEEQQDVLRGVVVMTTNAANRMTEVLAQNAAVRQSIGPLSTQAERLQEWVEDNRARQPARDQKDAEDTALLTQLAQAEAARIGREQEAEAQRAAAARKLAEDLRVAEEARHLREKRMNAYLRALGAFVGLLVVALSPSTVSQAPTAWHAPLYGAYLLFVLVALVVVVVLPLREKV